MASAEQLAAYEAMVASQPDVERKGAKMPYTSLNGNMFSFLGDSGIGLRLAADQRREFIEAHQTRLYEANGAVLKEYVAVPDAMLGDAEQLHAYFAASYAYAQTLKPKATTRRKAQE